MRMIIIIITLGKLAVRLGVAIPFRDPAGLPVQG
jgi:hypothetical protein